MSVIHDNYGSLPAKSVIHDNYGSLPTNARELALSVRSNEKLNNLLSCVAIAQGQKFIKP